MSDEDHVNTTNHLHGTGSRNTKSNPAYPEWTREGNQEWLRNFGIARMGVLAFITMGSAFVTKAPGAYYLLGLYVFAFVTNHVYLRSLHKRNIVGPSQTWAQMFVDFAVVALTIGFTEGPISFFNFIFVVVVLEVGILLGLRQGFVFATLAAVFMFQQTMMHPSPDTLQLSAFSLWYNYGVQVMLMYLTAFISGYWNTRINRLREFQRDILDNMNAGFLVTDAMGLIRVHNAAASQILGLGDSSVLGRPIDEVMNTSLDMECPVLTALRSGQDYTSYEFPILHPSGKTVLLGLSTNQVHSTNNQSMGLIASFSDLTEMDAMRNELRRQDRMAVVGELAAGLAHEIRNPVAVIRGAMDELLTTENAPEISERLQKMALNESDHLNDIVQGFLNFSRDPSPTLRPIALGSLVEEVVELLRREYSDLPGVTFDITNETQSDLVLGDASQVKQVFVNIGHNAVEEMIPSGELHIRLLQSDDGPVVVRFEDSGPGINPDKIDKVFEPFFTLKDSGVGMGLAVCMRIITAHDGTIRATNRTGGGCSMIIQLPVARTVAKEL
jgi:PAS domain S-box-containing protein